MFSKEEKEFHKMQIKRNQAIMSMAFSITNDISALINSTSGTLTINAAIIMNLGIKLLEMGLSEEELSKIIYEGLTVLYDTFENNDSKKTEFINNIEKQIPIVMINKMKKFKELREKDKQIHLH